MLLAFRAQQERAIRAAAAIAVAQYRIAAAYMKPDAAEAYAVEYTVRLMNLGREEEGISGFQAQKD